jgi:hypothetical protein
VLHELIYVATLTTAEAVIKTLCRTYVERRRLLIVKRAQAL